MSDQYPTQPGPPGWTSPPPAPGGQPGWAPPPPSWSPLPGAVAQQPPPTRPWYKRGWFLLLVGFIAGGIVANTGTDPQATRTVTVTSIVERRVEVPASNKATATTSNTREAGAVLLQAKGTGNGNTKRFTAASDWDLIWSFRCNGEGYYSVHPEEAENRALLIGPTGDRTNKGVEHYHDAGRFHLTVITGPNCSWNLKAVTV